MSSVMAAFLPTPGAPLLNIPGTRAAQICCRRPTPSRQPARVYFSAATDEAPPNESIPVPRPPPQRPQPNAPPQRPSPYSSRGERPRPSGEGRGAPRPTFVPDPTATYYTKCGSCQAAYKMDPGFPGPRGKKVACSVCGNQWFQRADRLMVLKESEQMKEYPIEEKDQLMEQQQQARRERFRARREEGDRRGAPRRDGGREGQGGRRSNGRNYAAHSLFIGNLPFNAEQEDLEKVVGQVVEFTRVAIIRDPTGRSKGFAFADVKSEEAVQTAVSKLDGKEFGGRAITVRQGRKN